MLTLVVTFKPFCYEPVGLQQYAAAYSWYLNKPDEVVVLGDDLGSREQAEQYQWRYRPTLERGVDIGQATRAPLLTSFIREACRTSTQDYLCLMNSDLIVSPDFFSRLCRILSKYGSRCFVTGNRLDFRWGKPPLDPESYQLIWKNATGRYKYHTGGGTDYFVAHKSWWQSALPRIPPFLMGCLGWDNWLQWAGMNFGKPPVNATGYIDTLHPTHNYESLMKPNNLPGNAKLRSHPAIQYNRRLRKGEKSNWRLPPWVQVLKEGALR